MIQRDTTGVAPLVSILVAEPEIDIQSIYKSFFKDWAATIVSTGKECIDVYQNSDQKFDMIIIDSHIKDNNAYETLLKISKISPNQHVIVTSTEPAEEFSTRLKGANLVGGNIEFLQKPFSFTRLLSLVRAKVPRASKVRLRDHILAIYENPEDEIDDAITFLNYAYEKNETALFLVNMAYDIEGLKERMRAKGIDVNSLLSNDSLVILRNEDWYIPDKRVDKHRIIEQWNMLVERCINAGKNGLRAFCMMDCFFEHHFEEDVVDYEHTLPSKFAMSFVPVCAYRKEDIDNLSEDQKRRLIVCHSHVWTSNKAHNHDRI